MRKLILVGLVFLATPTASNAAPCLPDTLANYKLLGAGGCTIDNVTFADFDSLLLSAIPGAIEINAVDVSVTPSGKGFDFGFGIAPADDFYNVLIRYTASVAGLLGRNRLAMQGSSATGDGIVTAVEDKCIGGSFAAADPTSACSSGEAVTLIAIQNEVLNASFTPSSFFDVFTDITIDPGTFGTAGLQGTVTTRFTAVPEPLLTVLLGTGLAVSALRQRRRRNCPG